jgi:hypothetical protein
MRIHNGDDREPLHIPLCLAKPKGFRLLEESMDNRLEKLTDHNRNK